MGIFRWIFGEHSSNEEHLTNREPSTNVKSSLYNKWGERIGMTDGEFNALREGERTWRKVADKFKTSDYGTVINLKCPNCYGNKSFNGEVCIDCGYIYKFDFSKKDTAIMAGIMNLFAPKTYTPNDIIKDNSIVPAKPGVYAWYFDYEFASYFPKLDSLIEIDIESDKAWFMLYVGIAGEREDRTLRKRIYGEHLNQNTAGSTLRHSLSAILWKKIGLDIDDQLNSKSEKDKLNAWMNEHALVAWTETKYPKNIEDVMIDQYGELLPLNIKGNLNNPYYENIKIVRKLWRKKILSH